jgi:hypothetical protein
MNIRIEFEPKYFTREPDGERLVNHLDGEVYFYTQESGEVGRINIKVIDKNISQTPIASEKGMPNFYDRLLSKQVVNIVNVYISALNDKKAYCWAETYWDIPMAEIVLEYKRRKVGGQRVILE